MAIIYTYPDLGAVDGSEKLLVSDGTDENNTKTVTTAAYGAYINATYGGGGGSTIYQADGSITGNRQLSGANLYSLTLASLTSFNVQSPSLFTGTVQLDSTITIPTGASNGYVLTSDGAGVATWQAIPDSTILTVNGTANRISVTDSSGPNPVVDIDSAYVGQTSITTLGTIATGTWNATTIDELYGGTGFSSYNTGDLLYASAANTLSKLTIGTANKVLTVSGGIPSWITLSVNNSNWDGTQLAVANGGTGAVTAQAAIDTLTNVSAATNEHVLTKDTATGNAIWKASTGAAANTLYSGNGVVGSGRVATITDTLSFGGGSIVRNVNSIRVIEVTQESDFGPIIGGNINLVANTTYVIRGTVSCSNTLTVSGDGIAITGLNRNLDKIVYTGASDFITIADVNFTLSDVWLSSTNSASLLVRASNVAASGFNNGRTKILEIINCQFRNCYNVMDINGFDLVDISNTLFFYVQAPSIGLRFRDTSKIEISSCELIRWYDETTNPTPSGWATCSMIELRANNFASFGAVNINGCIIHPQQTQNGIDINTGSTTGFGTISSSAFINTGLTTGKVFLPEASSLPDYSQTATYAYDVFANQGILNSASGTVTTVNGNTQTTAISAGTPTIVDLDVAAVQQAGVRFTVDTVTGRNTYIGKKPVYVSIHCTFTYLKQDKGTDDYTFSIAKNGTVLSGSTLSIPDLDDLTGAGSLVYGTLMVENDYIELYVESAGGDGMLVPEFTMLIRE